MMKAKKQNLFWKGLSSAVALGLVFSAVLPRAEAEGKGGSRKEKYATLVTSLSPKGYSIVHGDHQHFIEGLPESNSKFLDSLVVSDEACWEPEDVIMMRRHFFVIRGKDSYRIALRRGADRARLTVSDAQFKALQDEQIRAKGSLGDGYVFDPKDIVDETEAGYVVRHGDHFHFIPKDSLLLKVSGKKDKQNGGRPALIHGEEDGYVFDPKDIVSEDEKGYVVRHGDHFHYIYKKDVAGGKRPAPGTATNDAEKPEEGNKLSSAKLKAGSDPVTAAELQKLEYFAKEKGLRLSDLEVRGGLVIWPHHDHFHADPLASLKLPAGVKPVAEDTSDAGKKPGAKPQPTKDEVTPQGLKAPSDTLSEADLAKVRYFSEKHNIPMKKLQVTGGQLIWPHTDHFHADPISELPSPPKHEDHLTAQGFKAGSDTLSERDLKKVEVVRKDIGFERENMLVKDGVLTVFDPKSKRTWVYTLSDILLTEDFPKTEEVNEQGLKKGSDLLSDEDYAKVKHYADHWGLALGDLYAKQGLLAWQRFDQIRTTPIASLESPPPAPAPAPAPSSNPADGENGGNGGLSEKEKKRYDNKIEAARNFLSRMDQKKYAEKYGEFHTRLDTLEKKINPEDLDQLIQDMNAFAEEHDDAFVD